MRLINFQEDRFLVDNKPAYLYAFGYLKEKVHSLTFECPNASSFEERHDVLCKLAGLFDREFELHQISPEKSTIAHYRTDWDFHYYCNSGWNQRKTMDFFILTFNEKREEKSNRELYRQVVSLLNNIEFPQPIRCTVKYVGKVNEAKALTDAKTYADALEDRFVHCANSNYVGKIKALPYDTYGFFKKGAKTKYSSLTPIEVVEAYYNAFPEEQLKCTNGLEHDAVFLPGNIHGCDWQIYIIYFNPEANEGDGCFEIEVCDYRTLLKLYEDVNHNAEDFFSLLPDYFQGEWDYCNAPCESSDSIQIDTFDSYLRSYHTADYLSNKGDAEEEMNFIINWAKKVAECYEGK